MKVQTVAQIVKEWRAEGRTFRIREAVAEREQQCLALRTAREDEILADPERYSADLVESIRDHRAAAAIRATCSWA